MATLKFIFSATAAILTAGMLCYELPASASSNTVQEQGSSELSPSESLTVSLNDAVDMVEGYQLSSAPLTQIEPNVNADPIGSPHPLPWNWVTDVQNSAVSSAVPRIFYYRTPALVSPDGNYAAYSRMQLNRVVDPTQSQINSILFLENLATGDIQFLTASSPVMQNVLIHNVSSQEPGMLSMLMPISWSEDGDRVLVRAFESVFNTGVAADYAIVWYQTDNHVEAVVPTNAQYSHAVLLGWSQAQPDQALFRMGNLGDEIWPLMSMGETGGRTMVTVDQPVTYGQTVSAVWSGPQFSAIDTAVID